ncbi:NAD(P)-dependent oxidoreductase [Gracilimonas tropica]|uniref:NAD(P)-dependent oxidoreductase n=1 Tax=Gracilimonas tropica TaxID=454600 RepID=UPI0003789B4F|nr:NAD(P)-binding oxidoreductase [Gracilimonas tropica]
MTTLVVGANGSTGTWLIKELLSIGHDVKAIVRPSSSIPEGWEKNSGLEIIRADISNISVNEMANCIKDCQAVLSCLGHNPSMKGMFGYPRKLVTETVKLICSAIQLNAPGFPFKFVLMNTAGNSNRDLQESISSAQKFVVGLIRLILPPHADNEDAADFLRLNVGQNNSRMEWVVVRPDTLINDENVTEYEVHPSPIRSAIFNPGKTSRINVGNFMAKLITENSLWNQWKGQMPVIYNKMD